MENKKRARVDLITGFLGAGKTTLIRKYMEYLDRRGISYMVIENEFGAAGVDASILGGNVRELSGGCICCGQKVNFHNLLLELAGEAERIIVEPSGVFNADDFFDIMDSPVLKEAAEYGFMAGVVNPAAMDGTSGAAEQVLLSELACAGAVVWSHTDVVPEGSVKRAEEKLTGLLGAMPPAFDGQKINFDRLMECAPVRRAHERDRTDHSTLFQSAVAYPTGRFTREGLTRAVEALFGGEAGAVLRVKGTVLGNEGRLTVNAAPGQIEIVPSSGEIGVNVIGNGLRRKVIRALLEENGG